MGLIPGPGTSACHGHGQKNEQLEFEIKNNTIYTSTKKKKGKEGRNKEEGRQEVRKVGGKREGGRGGGRKEKGKRNKYEVSAKNPTVNIILSG